MKLHHIISVLVLIISTYSCHHAQPKHHHKKHKARSVSKDTLFNTKRSAISVWQDTATLDKRRKQYGDDGFYTGADDDVYYSSVADSFLQSRHLPVIMAEGYKYLKFVQTDKTITVVKIDTLQQIYKMYFFDPSKKPYDVDVTDIENEYNKFYH